eukprot:UN29274
MNYTGDRLNFGLACEQAKSEGINVRMLVVADDCALPKDKRDPDGKRNRGVAGTILVQKVAGYLAECGKSLDEVYKGAELASSQIKTIGVSANACKLFDSERRNSMKKDELELGLGIHGEPGLKKIPLLGAKELIKMMVDYILDSRKERDYLPKFKTNKRVAVMLNDL